MLIPANIKVHLYCGVTDMRKSINTLAISMRSENYVLHTLIAVKTNGEAEQQRPFLRIINNTT